MKFFLTYLLCFSCLLGHTQEKWEVLLVGTMHEVPKLLKNSYRPLYRKSLEFDPEAIFVERSMPADTLSWNYLKTGYSKGLRDFYQYSVQVQQEFPYDQDSLNYWLAKEFGALSPEEFKKIRLAFAYNRDYANYFYYQYIEANFPNGHKKSRRNEFYELSRKLGLRLKHKRLYSADDQQTNGAFHNHWNACEEAQSGTMYEKSEKRLGRKLVSREILPSLVGRYGIINNRLRHLILLDSLSALRYSNQNLHDCEKAVDLFDQRNNRIAKNLGGQIKENDFKRSVLFIGAAHIIGVKKELQRQYPDIKVTLFDEL